MATRRVNDQNAKTNRRPPAKTPEDREDQLIAKAFDLVEKKFDEGTASSQETVHFLRLGSRTEKLAQQFKEEEIKLLRIRSETFASQKRTEEMMAEALDAFRSYATGQVPQGDDDGDH